jgi:EmrB/QacA subfamily drug resistance transporter
MPAREARMTALSLTRRPHYALTFAVLLLAALAFSLLQSMVAPALPELQSALSTSPTGVSWILTAYLLSASIATPIAGRLGDMFGKERVLVVVLIALALGTVVSALATSIGPMLAGRAVQGIGGAVFPLGIGIVRDEFPGARVATGISLISATFAAGGGVGIVLAGPIVDHLGYHYLFWIPLVAVVLALVATWLFVPESPVRSPGKVNWLGAALLSGWLLSLLVGLSEAPTWGWLSPRVLGLFALALVLVLAWIRAESRSSQPLVDMKMMRVRGVWTVNLATVLIGFGMYNSFLLIPEYVALPRASGYGFGASVTQAGLFLLPSTIAMLIVSPIAGRMAGRIGSRMPLILGAAFAAAAFALLTVAHSERWQIYLAAAILGIGIGLAFSSMANLIVEAVSSHQTGIATGMNTIMRTIGGALGTTIAASVIAGGFANGLPRESRFEIAFALSSGALVVGVLAALLVPRHVRGAARGPSPSPASVLVADDSG